MHNTFLVTAIIIVTVCCGSDFAAASRGTLQLFSKSDYPDARCLDGTQGGMYIHAPNSTGGDSSSRGAKVLLVMQGGGLCPVVPACYERSFTDLGSSANWSQTENLQRGFYSNDCSINPGFCQFWIIRLNYCDGNLFSSDSTEPVNFMGRNLYLRGTAMRRAALKYISRKFGSIDEFVVGGDSAGGLATFMHASSMIEELNSMLSSPVKRVGAVPLSGFFPANVLTVQGLPIISNAWHAMLRFCNCTPSANKRCVAWARANGVDEAECLTAAYAYRFSTDVPFFVFQSSSDQWQIDCELLAGEGPLPNTEKCLGAEGYQKTQCPARDGDFPALRNCTPKQALPIVAYQDYFRNLTVYNTSNTSGFSPGRGNGVFLISCYKHVAALSNGYFLDTRIKGVNMASAVAKWWRDTNRSSNSDAHVYIDCARQMGQTSTSWECNPLCNTSWECNGSDEEDTLAAMRLKHGNKIGLLF
jgi:hypothetical protein